MKSSKFLWPIIVQHRKQILTWNYKVRQTLFSLMQNYGQNYSITSFPTIFNFHVDLGIIQTSCNFEKWNINLRSPGIHRKFMVPFLHELWHICIASNVWNIMKNFCFADIIMAQNSYFLPPCKMCLMGDIQVGIYFSKSDDVQLLRRGIRIFSYALSETLNLYRPKILSFGIWYSKLVNFTA